MGGASSRDAFKLAVVKLQTEEVPATEAFWDSLWKTQVTCQDIYELIRPADVRSIVETCPGNVEIILSQSIIQLFQVVETPYPVYFEQGLTCVRVLTRLLPLFMELKKESIRKLFWEVTDHSKRMISPAKGEQGNGIDDGAAATRTSRPSLGSMDRSMHQERPAYESEPLAVILVNTLFHLLFLPDFTIDDPDLDFKEEDVRTDRFRSALLWAQGLGSLPSESGSSSSEGEGSGSEEEERKVKKAKQETKERPAGAARAAGTTGAGGGATSETSAEASVVVTCTAQPPAQHPVQSPAQSSAQPPVPPVPSVPFDSRMPHMLSRSDKIRHITNGELAGCFPESYAFQRDRRDHYATGRWGEALVYQYLLRRYPEWDVQWLNEKTETKASYDVQLTRGGGGGGKVGATGGGKGGGKRGGKGGVGGGRSGRPFSWR